MYDIDPKIFRKNRYENFSIEVDLKPNYLTKIPEITLSISTNGRQYTSVSFTKHEWLRIKKQVNEAFKGT